MYQIENVAQQPTQIHHQVEEKPTIDQNLSCLSTIINGHIHLTKNDDSEIKLDHLQNLVKESILKLHNKKEIGLAQHKEKWRALVKAVMNLWVP